MSVFIYGQHLSGTGHFVRCFELGRALAAVGEVTLLDGGQPVPRVATEKDPILLALPRITRRQGELTALAPGDTYESAMRTRRELLLEHLAATRPDIVIVEHFPFSKWELAEEIRAVVDAAKGQGARILASLRDISPLTSDDVRNRLRTDEIHQELRERFDLVLVHADERYVDVERDLPTIAGCPVPVEFTGLVSEKPRVTRSAAAGGDVIVSAGGAGGQSLRDLCRSAWKILAKRRPPEARLVIIQQLDPEQAGRGADEDGVLVVPFQPGLVDTLMNAGLSISSAGYNTCANILETKVRAILVPDERMSDQRRRAEKMAELGAARTLRLEGLTADVLAEAMSEAMEGPAPTGWDVAIDGARKSAEIISALIDA